VPTGETLAACYLRHTGYYITYSQTGHICANIRHHTGYFMALDHGISSIRMRPVVHMYIRTADANTPGLHNDLVGLRRWFFYLAKLNLAGFCHHGLQQFSLRWK
jgi:hypothetical protein